MQSTFRAGDRVQLPNGAWGYLIDGRFSPRVMGGFLQLPVCLGSGDVYYVNASSILARVRYKWAS